MKKPVKPPFTIAQAKHLDEYFKLLRHRIDNVESPIKVLSHRMEDIYARLQKLEGKATNDKHNEGVSAFALNSILRRVDTLENRVQENYGAASKALEDVQDWKYKMSTKPKENMIPAPKFLVLEWVKFTTDSGTLVRGTVAHYPRWQAAEQRWVYNIRTHNEYMYAEDIDEKKIKADHN